MVTYCITHSIIFLHWSAARSPNGSSLGRSSFGDRPNWGVLDTFSLFSQLIWLEQREHALVVEAQAFVSFFKQKLEFEISQDCVERLCES